MIIDSFIFFNELDLLEVRLGVLDPYVDRFILVESDRTFQNDPKPLYFRENLERYEYWLPKITHVVVRDLPGGSDTWKREDFQRSCVSRGLRGCRPDDILMLSDLDEIPNLETWDHCTPTVWWHRFFYYYVNLEIHCRIKGTVAVTLQDFWTNPEICGDAARLRGWRHYHGRVLEGSRGGWHFSYLGGPEAIERKIRAFAHNELLAHANQSNILQAINTRWQEGKDLFHREIYKFRWNQEDSTLPKYLLEHRGRFAHFWKT